VWEFPLLIIFKFSGVSLQVVDLRKIKLCSLDFLHVRVELDAPLLNFRMACKLVHKLGDSFVSLARVVELVVLESLHFVCI
jgi:hypothetical protein